LVIVFLPIFDFELALVARDRTPDAPLQGIAISRITELNRHHDGGLCPPDDYNLHAHAGRPFGRLFARTAWYRPAILAAVDPSVVAAWKRRTPKLNARPS
jgi:hypothetical protein